MAMDTNMVGAVSGTGADVNASRQLKVVPETDASANAANVGAVKVFSEVDSGYITGEPRLFSGEVDADYRSRVATDLVLDEENFDYTAQNTGKHTFANTTMAATFAAGQVTLNSGSITTVTTGAQLATYAFFPVDGSCTLSLDAILGFSATPSANVFCEWGVGIAGTATTAPTDGVFFRLTSAGLHGVASSNGTETVIGPFPGPGGVGTWTYALNQKYQFIAFQSSTHVTFWVNADDDNGTYLLGVLEKPAAQHRMSMADSGQVFFKERITGGAAGAVLQMQIGSYTVLQGGQNNISTVGTAGLRKYGAYQGLSGGTMGSLATYPNSTNPTAAAPSNTALTANLPAGLGGQGAVTAAVAAAADGIWGSYQVPAGSVNFSGRRLVLRGIRIDAVNNGAAVATTATTIQFSLAFGHTAVSLATAEAATAKAPRRISLGFMTWPVGAAIGAQPQGGPLFVDLGDAPVFVNPGEFVALVGKFLIGTATASQVINFVWQPVYGWE